MLILNFKDWKKIEDEVLCVFLAVFLLKSWKDIVEFIEIRSDVIQLIERVEAGEECSFLRERIRGLWVDELGPNLLFVFGF